jgi:hydroxymethylglutaryl-CoA reductase
MVTVGLAQNFAALRALVTEGIQRGHMALHARNIAISAGTPPASVDEVTAYMIDTGKIRLGVAKSYIEQRGLGLGLTPFYSNSGMSSNLALTTTTTTTTTTTITTNGTDSSHGLNGIVLATRRRAK